MKKYFLVLFFININVNLNCQSFYPGLDVFYDNNGQNNMRNPSYFYSDFGPRDLHAYNRSEYDWHQGIDISPAPDDIDIGYPLRAIEGGNIRTIIGANSIKCIVIDGVNNDFGYVHIFQNNPFPQTINNITFGLARNQNNPAQTVTAIIVPYNNSYRVLIAERPDEGDYYVDINQMRYFAQSWVAQNDIIAVIGDSGTGPAHLHLNRYESIAPNVDFINGVDDAIDPLEVIAHTGVDYDVTLHYRTNQSSIDAFPEGINITYDNNPRRPQQLLIRPKLLGGGNGATYTSAVFNLSRVQWQLKKNNEPTFYLIKGANYPNLAYKLYTTPIFAENP